MRVLFNGHNNHAQWTGRRPRGPNPGLFERPNDFERTFKSRPKEDVPLEGFDFILEVEEASSSPKGSQGRPVPTWSLP